MGNNIQKIVRLIVIFSVNTACNSSSSTGVLLEDVDFSNGKYALYIKHKELGEFMVQDKTKFGAHFKYRQRRSMA